MTTIDRRSFLGGAAAAAAGALAPGLARAMEIAAERVTGTLADVEHIVILMQENRSFDHYFGTLRGVRGFNDPRAVRLYGSGASVFQQPNKRADGSVQEPATLLPFRPIAKDLGLAFLADLAHSWNDAQGAWNGGRHDGWVQHKTPQTMAYLQRSDIPYHFALADAFTVCDAYHCSIMASTDPNRYYLWTGWCGQNGSGDPDAVASGSTPGQVALDAATGNGVPPLGPVITNDEAGYNWRSYPERLQAAGIRWKLYQDTGIGLDAAGAWGWGKNPYIGNYGDNSLLYLTQYRSAEPGSPLHTGAKTGTTVFDSAGTDATRLFDQLRSDVQAGTLPQVAWIAAPEAYSEHPNWPANYGAWYIDNVLSALTSNPAVWARTVLLVCYDENDGFFDHVVPPTPPASPAQGASTVSTVNELYPGTANPKYPAGPYGLGARVPMLAISPWSKGGWVCSQVFDHTSVIRFIEQRFGVAEPNISPWRRAVCGDLTSAFDFSLRGSARPPRLPPTAAYAVPAGDVDGAVKHPNLAIDFPPPAMPAQEPGVRPARKLPYRLQADGQPSADGSGYTLRFGNAAIAAADPAAWFHVRTANDAQAAGSTGPWGYTVEAGKSLAETWRGVGPQGAYDLAVHGPNGFYRRFAGSLAGGGPRLAVRAVEDNVGGGIAVFVTNLGRGVETVTVTDRYTGAATQHRLAAGATQRSAWPLAASRRWYDLLVAAVGDSGATVQLAGHVETGADGVTDPLL